MFLRGLCLGQIKFFMRMWILPTVRKNHKHNGILSYSKSQRLTMGGFFPSSKPVSHRKIKMYSLIFRVLRVFLLQSKFSYWSDSQRKAPISPDGHRCRQITNWGIILQLYLKTMSLTSLAWSLTTPFLQQPNSCFFPSIFPSRCESIF